MTMNKFMHPRNIYRTPPDFKQLAIDFEDFRKISKIDIKGHVHIDFKDEESLRTLTKCLLKKDFGLDIELPANKLIPTLPLRLNYILWIEDIVNTCNLNDVIGIDIGCGASCVYPILAVTQNKSWKMYATETNADSIEFAKRNIETNKLQEKISIITECKDNEPFATVVHNQTFTGAIFTMCNPPFFDENQSPEDEQESTQKNRTGKRKPPNNAKTGSPDEIMIAGGEVEFVSKMIENSKNVGNMIQIYTTMLGCKSSFTAIQQELWQNGITNFCTTKFCQGQTTRWGIAWTLQNDLLLRTVPNYGQSSVAQKKQMTFTVKDTMNIEKVHSRLLAILQGLEGSKLVSLQEGDNSGDKTNRNLIEFYFIADKNSWSNQRRRRRAEARARGQTSNDSQNPSQQSNKNSDSEANMSVNNQTVVKYNDEKIANGSPPLLHVNVKIVKEINVDVFQSTIFIILEYLNGTARIDGAHQLLQFIINTWKNVAESA